VRARPRACARGAELGRSLRTHAHAGAARAPAREGADHLGDRATSASLVFLVKSLTSSLLVRAPASSQKPAGHHRRVADHAGITTRFAQPGGIGFQRDYDMARAKGVLMYAVIGRVQIKPGQEAQTLAMVSEHGIAMVQGMAGSAGGYWARSEDGGDLIQHSVWLFDTEEHARAAETTFSTLRDMPEAPATFISVDVCKVIGQA
jgi:hypothetical protein